MTGAVNTWSDISLLKEGQNTYIITFLFFFPSSFWHSSLHEWQRQTKLHEKRQYYNWWHLSSAPLFPTPQDVWDVAQIPALIRALSWGEAPEVTRDRAVSLQKEEEGEKDRCSAEDIHPWPKAWETERFWQTTSSLHENTCSHLFLCSHVNPAARTFPSLSGNSETGNFLHTISFPPHLIMA